MNDTTIILVGEDARMWALMQALKQLGAFSVKNGSVKIDFNSDGKIGNVKIEQNYRSLSTV